MMQRLRRPRHDLRFVLTFIVGIGIVVAVFRGLLWLLEHTFPIPRLPAALIAIFVIILVWHYLPRRITGAGGVATVNDRYTVIDRETRRVGVVGTTEYDIERCQVTLFTPQATRERTPKFHVTVAMQPLGPDTSTRRHFTALVDYAQLVMLTHICTRQATDQHGPDAPTEPVDCFIDAENQRIGIGNPALGVVFLKKK